MICQHCKSSVDDSDKFCPKCGGTLTQPSSDLRGLGVAASPPVMDATAVAGARVAQDRIVLPESGTKYRGLKLAADLMIKGAAVMRIVCYVLACLGTVSTLMLLRGTGALGLVVAVGVGIGIAAFGWFGWLFATIHGELMYVVIDVEENLRRRT